MPRVRRVVTLTVAALTMGTLAACGGSGDGGSKGEAPAASPDRAAATSLVSSVQRSALVRSGKLDLSVKLRADGQGSGLPGSASITVKGPFQSVDDKALPRFAFDVDVDLPGQKRQTLGIVVTGDAAYLSAEGETYSLGGDLFAQLRQAYARAQAQAGSQGSSASGLAQLKALGIDPLSWLRDLRDAGDEEIDGTATTHVHGTVDVGRLLTDVNGLIDQAGALGLGTTTGASPRKLTERQLSDIRSSVRAATFDVWTAKDDRTLRKLTVHVGIDVPEDVRGRADGLHSGELDVALTFTDVNEDQAIVAPKDAQPIGDLSQLFGGLLAGAGVGTGSSSGSSSSAPPSAATSALIQCLQEAKGDVDRIRACSSSAEQ